MSISDTDTDGKAAFVVIALKEQYFNDLVMTSAGSEAANPTMTQPSC
ncbi:MAG: hypothetical protein M1395_07305 [Bacteroidetes bacterium]|nr:hypothetical protein [Bacteroidota bacterium]